jgi:hypothetical protein
MVRNLRGVGYGKAAVSHAPRLERRTAVPRMGACRARLDASRDCGGTGGDPWRGEPMAQAGPRRWPDRPPAPAATGASAEAHAHPTGAGAGPARAGRRSLRLLRRPVDRPTDRDGHPDALWRAVPPSAHEPLGAGARLDAPEAAPAGHPARRSGHPPLVRSALAGAEKKRRPKGGPSSGEPHRAALCCPPVCAPLPRVARRPSCGCA